MINKINSDKLLSVIIPTYKQARIIVKNVQVLKNILDKLGSEYEIIVVVDGTEIDDSLQKLKQIQDKKIIVLGYPKNRGKGHAVRYGMSQAKGDIVAFIDADLDIDPSSISMLLAHFEWYDADIIVGSKLHPVSKVHYPPSRIILSWGYRTLVKALFGLSVRDTQVGIKLFKKKVIKDVLPRLVVKTYAFDIEFLAVSYYLGFKRIFEAPIRLDFSGASSIVSRGFWRTIFLMLWDTIAVFYRLRIVKYYDNKNRSKWININEDIRK